VADIVIPNLVISSYSADRIPPRKVVIRNVKFDMRWVPGETTDRLAIRMDYDTTPVRNLIQNDEIDVYDFNQVAGDNFRVYYAQQAAQYVVPQTIFNPAGTAALRAAPAAGVCNQHPSDQ